MSVDLETQAALLLTANLRRGDKPLTNAQWRGLVKFLDEWGDSPKDLLEKSLDHYRGDWDSLLSGRSPVPINQVDSLLSRGAPWVLLWTGGKMPGSGS